MTQQQSLHLASRVLASRNKRWKAKSETRNPSNDETRKRRRPKESRAIIRKSGVRADAPSGQRQAKLGPAIMRNPFDRRPIITKTSGATGASESTGNNWEMENPTRATLSEVGITLEGSHKLGDRELARLEEYRQGDTRVEFMSVFPMNQAKLFENEFYFKRKYKRRIYLRNGRSQHYHYAAGIGKYETFSGTRMVFSSIIEMLSNIIVAKAVGTKHALYERAAATPDIGWQSLSVRRSFEVCTDCPASLIPIHIKSVPNPVCETVTSLPGNAPRGEAWNKALCPDWCLSTEPVEQTPTGSGMVSVRVCKLAG